MKKNKKGPDRISTQCVDTQSAVAETRSDPFLHFRHHDKNRCNDLHTASADRRRRSTGFGSTRTDVAETFEKIAARYCQAELKQVATELRPASAGRAVTASMRGSAEADRCSNRHWRSSLGGDNRRRRVVSNHVLRGLPCVLNAGLEPATHESKFVALPIELDPQF